MKKIITIITLLFITCMFSSCNNTSDYIDYYKYVGCTFDDLVAAEGQPDDDFMYTYYRTAYGIDGATIKFSPSFVIDNNDKNTIAHVFIYWYDVDSGKIDSIYKKAEKNLSSIYGNSTYSNNTYTWYNGKIGLVLDKNENYILVAFE